MQPFIHANSTVVLEEPLEGGGEIEAAAEAGSGLVIAGRDSAPPLQLIPTARGGERLPRIPAGRDLCFLEAGFCGRGRMPAAVGLRPDWDGKRVRAAAREARPGRRGPGGEAREARPGRRGPGGEGCRPGASVAGDSGGLGGHDRSAAAKAAAKIGGQDRRSGPSAAARLGAPLQCHGSGGTDRSQAGGGGTAADPRAGSRVGGAGRSRPRPGARWRGALALY
jgi:hypothetical protein